MSSIAQKLCDEIVEPALKLSTDSTSEKPSRKLVYHCPNNKQNRKTTKSVVIEKKKVINKLMPRDSTASKTVINKFKSKDTPLKKKIVDIAVNTLVTGPLRCDNNCVTMVRRRDNNCSCKCAQKRLNFKASVKQIQTFENKSYSLTDKACARCIETISCGTQFLENLRNDIKPQINIGMNAQMSSGIRTQNGVKPFSFKSRQEILDSNKPTNLSYTSAKRWALSQYPTRGPDF